MWAYCWNRTQLSKSYKEMLALEPTSFAIDIETNGLNPFAEGAKIVLVQVSIGDYTTLADVRRLDKKTVSSWLNAIFKQPQVKILHNAPFDLSWLTYFYPDLVSPTPLYDTMIAERLLTAGLMADCSLKAVTLRYLNIEMSKDEQKSFLLTEEDSDFTDSQLNYAAADTEGLGKIMHLQLGRLAREKLMTILKIEMALLPIAVKAGVHGIEIDITRWRTHIAHLEAEAVRLQAELEEQLQPYLLSGRKSDATRDGLTRYYFDQDAYLAAVSEYEAQAQSVYDNVIASNPDPKQVKEDALAHSKQWAADNRPPAGTSMHEMAHYADVIEDVYNYYWEEHKPNPHIRSLARANMREWKRSHTAPTYVGQTINLASPQQKATALLALGVPLPETPSSTLKRKADPTILPVYSTARSSLKKFAGEFPLIDKIIEWTGYSKLISSFGESVILQADSRHRLHPRFNIVGAEATGRFSCSGPNVQQIPANALGQELRNCFIAGEGKVLVCADYSQIELRILAELSGEEAMYWAFDNSVDLHSLTAFKMFPEVREKTSVTQEEMDRWMVQASEGREDAFTNIHKVLDVVKSKCDKQRKYAKIINFAIPYGQTKYGFSEGMGITPGAAQAVMDAYFIAYPKIATWLDKTSSVGLNRLYVQSALGRKRYFRPADQATRSNGKLYRTWQNRCRRAMGNQPIQSSSADITKIAIVRIENALKMSGLDATQVMFIHDEIVVECSENDGEAVLELVCSEMKQAARKVLKRCPVEVSAKIGATWSH